MRKDIDESGLHTLKHALTDLAMLVTYIERDMTFLDDRLKPSSTQEEKQARETEAFERRFKGSPKEGIHKEFKGRIPEDK